MLDVDSFYVKSSRRVRKSISLGCYIYNFKNLTTSMKNLILPLIFLFCSTVSGYSQVSDSIQSLELAPDSIWSSDPIQITDSTLTFNPTAVRKITSSVSSQSSGKGKNIPTFKINKDIVTMIFPDGKSVAWAVNQIIKSPLNSYHILCEGYSFQVELSYTGMIVTVSIFTAGKDPVLYYNAPNSHR